MPHTTSPQTNTAAAAEVFDLRIKHEQDVVAFERSRADGSDSQAAATGAGAVAAGAIVVATHPHFNVALGVAAGLLISTTLAAVLARARYPPPLRLVEL